MDNDDDTAQVMGQSTGAVGLKSSIGACEMMKILGAMVVGWLVGGFIMFILLVFMSGIGEVIMGVFPIVIMPLALIGGGMATGVLIRNRAQMQRTHITRLLICAPGIPLILLLIGLKGIQSIEQLGLGFCILWLFASWVGTFSGWGLRAMFSMDC